MSYQNIKEEVVKITKELSIEDVNDIFYRIILEKKLEQSEDDIKSGRVYTTEQAKEKLKKWFK
jgi:cell division protein FtsX